MTAKLYAISYSPWSARARWALDYYRVPYEVREYIPMLGEPLLRVRLREFSGKVSVPALVDGDVRLTDSRRIAEYAASVGDAPSDLFPAQDGMAIDRWHNLSERMLEAGRALVAWRTSQSGESMLASVPFPTPGPLKPLGRGLAQLGIVFLAEKYEFDPSTTRRHVQIIRLGLIALRDAVQRNSGAFLLGHLTWADLAMVSAMQAALPASNDVFPLDDAIRPLWTTRDLAEEFADLEVWRDGIFRALGLI